MVHNCWKIDYFKKNFGGGQRIACTKNSLEHFNQISSPEGGGSSTMPCHFTHYLFQAFEF